MTLIAVFVSAIAAGADEGAFFFEREVRPILVEHCHSCHGPEKQKSALRLDSAAGMLEGGSRGPAVIPGDAGKSLLVQFVSGGGELDMPPERKLSPRQVETLRRWVTEGAKWPDADGLSPTPKSSGGIDIDSGREHWAFRPLAATAPPNVRNAAWAKSPVDYFVLSKLEASGLAPAPTADKRTLIRRVTFDLIGLPPAPGDVAAFEADASPDAFARVVERLLASPRYGERWGRHWLDIVRYTDSFDSRASTATDPVEIWRYRDWVVRALNDDMPYDAFLREQIAGDLLSGPEGIIATGALAIGNWPQGDADKEKMVTDIVDDQVDLVTRGFLGVTLACARCHDHKFDPFTMEDYYGLAGIFFSSSILPGPGQKTEGSPILHLPIASKEELDARAAREAKLGTLREEREALTAEARRAWARTESARTADYVRAALQADGAGDSGLHPEAVLRWRQYLGLRPAVLGQVQERVQDFPGLTARRGVAEHPSAVANASDEERRYITILQPPRTLVVHPSPGKPAVISWRSPIDGELRVSASVSDADATCGDGVRAELASRPGSALIAAVDVMNGGAAELGADAPVRVGTGGWLTLRVLPRGDYSCDSTVVNFVIRAEGGDSWELRTDVVDQFSQGNPWPDASGREGVWWIEDPNVEVSGDVILTAPIQAAAGLAAEAREAALEKAAAMIQAAAAASAAETAGPLAELFASLTGDQGPYWVTALPAPAGSKLEEVQREIAAMEAAPPPPLEYAVGIQEGGVPGTEHEGIRDVRIHRRGDYNNLGDAVPRRMPAVLTRGAQPQISAGSGRVELAQWVADPANPLTARVMVNRIWQHHFGEGIVRTPGDFGTRGEAPTHPELLDYLAAEFIASGWSVKAMHRMILNSAVYQQGSHAASDVLAMDPENRLFSRMNRRRLDAESLRDSLLAVSGRLDLTAGGPAFADLRTPRRTLYYRTVRSDRTTYPMLFDAADPTAIIPKRTEATVAPQALFLMNHPFVLEEAEALAVELQRESKGTDALADALHRRLYARPPTDADIQIARSLLGGAPASPEAVTAYTQVLLSANEFVFVD